MKIKLFEQYTENLFTEMTEDDWINQLDSKPENFTTDELDWLNNSFEEWVINDQNRNPRNIIQFSKNKNYKRNILYTYKSFSIAKLNDDWYYVYDNYYSKFYKCDTFNGLKQCLNYCCIDLP